MSGLKYDIFFINPDKVSFLWFHTRIAQYLSGPIANIFSFNNVLYFILYLIDQRHLTGFLFFYRKCTHVCCYMYLINPNQKLNHLKLKWNVILGIFRTNCRGKKSSHGIEKWPRELFIVNVESELGCNSLLITVCFNEVQSWHIFWSLYVEKKYNYDL